jgi:ATP-dependent helicase/nuclease subunit B
MLAAMVKSVFLGWDKPFAEMASQWLLERQDELPRWLVIVPTAQAGRRLREMLAERSQALLTPQIRTPGSFLKSDDPKIATAWTEQVAWLETLESIGDWSAFDGLFPEAPDGSEGWAAGLAREMVKLRHALQENGLSLSSAARLLAGTVESKRWNALGRLEARMEKRLRSWGFESRSRILETGISLPCTFSGIILAGITEMPPIIERACLSWDGPVTVLIGAPESESTAFSPSGKPLECWGQRVLPWPQGAAGAVHLVADARQQASEALKVVAENATPSGDLALGSADTETGDELARAFTREGWSAFHPASAPAMHGLARWLRIWIQWLADPRLATMADLLALPETGILVKGRRAGKAKQLSRFRNDWMVLRPDDLRHRIANSQFRSDEHRESAMEVLAAAESLESWRSDLLRKSFTGTLERLLDTLARTHSESQEQADEMTAWLANAAPVIEQTGHGAGFWIELMLSDIPPPMPQPPDGRVLDVQGWLELYFEPGRHLILCGMNEGHVPARNTADPWLGESAAKELGLTLNSDRAARDAFLYHSMLESRRQDGRTDVFCAKSNSSGESLLPSRLLLAAERSELPDRVKFLFREIEPPEAGLHWHADWKWTPLPLDVRKRLAVTSLASYLACPYRFYLKQAMRMQTPEPGRIEWNARDFGTIAHDVLERWGRDTDARALEKTEAIHEWLSAELDRVVASNFGPQPPLAVRVQTEALRQRFTWLSRIQAGTRAEGWETIEVEHKFEIPVGETTIVAMVDRIDRHRETGELRVIDYKTGKVDGVEKSHRRMLTANTTLPAHIGADSPVIHPAESRGKPADFRWTNLQLPLYAFAVEQRDGIIPTPCYFTLGATEPDVALHEWTGFSKADLDAAKECTEWVIENITNGVFWPPAEKVTYDDFAVLAAGRPIEEVFSPIPTGITG